MLMIFCQELMTSQLPFNSFMVSLMFLDVEDLSLLPSQAILQLS